MPLDLLSQVVQLAQSAANRIKIRSALNPMLWLCAIVTPTCLAFALKFSDVPNLQLLLVIVGLLPVVVTCLESIGFAIFKPDKLQSEDYQLRYQRLQIQEKNRQVVVDRDIPRLSNPDMRQQAESGAQE